MAQYINVTDRRSNTALCVASRGKNVAIKSKQLKINKVKPVKVKSDVSEYCG